MFSDFELTNQLYSFMVAIPKLWSWEQLHEMFVSREEHQEQRGSDSKFLQFEFGILEVGTKDDGNYVHLFVSVVDPSRPMRQKGGSVVPLSTSFLFFANGKIDMPLASEIYERPY